MNDGGPAARRPRRQWGTAPALPLGPSNAVRHAPRWPRRDDFASAADARAEATYAALDLGTNNCRLLIARPTADGFRVVDAFSRIIRLGEGLAAIAPHQRGGDRARGRGASGLPRQDARRGMLRARGSSRPKSAARRRTRRPFAPASPKKPASNWRSSIRRPRRGLRRPAAPSCSIRRPRASSCSISAAARPNWCGSAGPAPAAAGRRRPTSSAGRRCRSASSRSPSATAANVVSREIYDAMIDEVARFVQKFAACASQATSTAFTCSARRAR